jgi:predicted nucleotidyltransferase
MGGSSGGSTFTSHSPEKLQQEVRAAELKGAEAAFQPALSAKLNEFLSRVNDRNSELTNQRLEDVKEALESQLEETISLKFGGSVAKHTYVDGFSDVDLLLVLKSAVPADRKPIPVLTEIAAHLAEELGRNVSVSKGKIAVTLTYDDGEEIQLIPAVHHGNALHVPSWFRDDWSKIDPDGFRKALVKQNSNCSGKLVPTIKLAKAINATLPEAQRLSGYHIEAMSIAAFKSYTGPLVIEKMLPHLIREMSELVKSPIRDSSGQSIHVDAYLGRSNSELRKRMSHLLDRTFRRMENATAAQSIEQWSTILGV